MQLLCGCASVKKVASGIKNAVDACLQCTVPAVVLLLYKGPLHSKSTIDKNSFSRQHGVAPIFLRSDPPCSR